MLAKFVHQKHQNINITGNFVSGFLSSLQNSLFLLSGHTQDAEVNTHCYDWLTVLHINTIKYVFVKHI